MRLVPLLLLLLIAPRAPAQEANLTVTAVSPAANLVSAARDAAVVVTFNTPVDPATFDRTSMMVFGRWSGVMEGTTTFEEANTRVRFVPQRPFSAGEQVTVSLARHLASAAGASMAKGYAWQFRVRTRPASLDLKETGRLSVRRPGEGWIQTYGAYAGDLDGDGYTDFTVPNERPGDVRVFMNDGAGGYGSFSTYPIPGGNRPSTNEGADFNLDGHLDFAVGNSRSDQVNVFPGDGTGRLLAPASYTTGDGVRGLTVLDADGDGFMDLAAASRDAGTVMLLRNDGDGTFTPAETVRRFSATAVSAADADGDGDPDLFVGAHDGGDLVLLLGDGEGRFAVSESVPAGGSPWMIATGDVDGDGRVDVVSANAESHNATVVLVGDHGRFLSATTYPTGAFPLAIDLGDLDGDGDLDLVTSNFDDGTWTVYENAGDGVFVNPRTLRASRAGSCAVLHDRDNDGTLDLTGIDELDDLLFFFTNTPAATPTEPSPVSSFVLLPTYPNPFSDRTTIPFRLQERAHVRLLLYDLLGREIRVLFDETYPPGEHRATWDGLDAAGRAVPGGVYFYLLETGGRQHTKPLLRL